MLNTDKYKPEIYIPAMKKELKEALSSLIDKTDDPFEKELAQKAYEIVAMMVDKFSDDELVKQYALMHYGGGYFNCKHCGK